VNAAYRTAILQLENEFRASMVAHGVARPDALVMLTRVARGNPVQLHVLEGEVPPLVLAALDVQAQARLAQ